MTVDNRTANRNYPLPDITNLLENDVVRLVDAFNAIDADVASILATLPLKADIGHGHQIGDISGLQTALDGKAAAGHTHGLNDLTDVDTSGATTGQFLKRVGTAWNPAKPVISDVDQLQTELDKRALLEGTAIRVPSGTTGQRPASPTGPLIRYNSTTAEFEGWDGTQWGAIAGAQSANMASASYTGDGAQTQFSLPRDPGVPENVLVWVGGVRQVPTADYTVSGTVLTLSQAPANGEAVDVLVVATIAELNVPADGSVSAEKFAPGLAGTTGLAVLAAETAADARANIGLGNSATRNVGTTSGTVAAGDDSRIVNTLQRDSNLSDVSNAATALSNIGGVPTSRTISAGTGLTGGGNLSADRTISLASGYVPLGVGQSWQAMTASRAANTTYTNTTGRPIMVNVSYTNTGNNSAQHSFLVDGFIVGRSTTRFTDNRKDSFTSAIVPAGSTYRVEDAEGTLYRWAELR